MKRSGAPDAPVVEELEPRILLSAGIHSALFGDVLTNAVTLDQAQTQLSGALLDSGNDQFSDTNSQRTELVFVDAATPDYNNLVQQLLANAGAGRNINVIIIDSGSDGIAQISQALMGYSNLDGIHIISHGTNGGVQLGNSWLDGDSLSGYSGLISGWADALEADADLLFYGCDLAGGEDGRSLVDELTALTGADIAASTDLSGHASLGGDWILEHRTGDIESRVVFGAKLAQNWTNTLAVTVDNSSSGTDVNTDSITISHLTSGTNRLLLVAIATEPNGGESVSSITYNGTVLTSVGSYLNATTNVRVEIWALVAPDTGTSDVVVNLTAQSKALSVSVVSFSGVDQFNPLGIFAAAEGDSTAASVNVASDTGDLVFGFVGVRKGIDATPGAGQTEYADVNIGNIEGAASTEDGAASVTTSWALDVSDKWVATGVSINAADSHSLWLADEMAMLVQEFGGAGFFLENPVTAGSFSNAFDLSIVEPAATANINALHYVSSTISLSGVGITSISLNPGDIIFSVDGNDTLGGVSVSNEDLIVFQPTSPGDYSSGTFTMLAAGLGASKDITAFSLVESDTIVPGSGTLSAGDFIYVAGSGGDMRRIVHYDATTGLKNFILDGDVDATVGFKPGANVITGIDLIEADITIGGRTLSAGQILVSLSDDDVSVGNLSGNISVADEDIFVLDLVSATDFSASLLFDGSDVSFVGDVHALTIYGAAGPTNTISGSVLEDIDGDGNLGDAVGIAGVDVDLYLDDGDGVIDAGDTYIGTTTTDGSGNYTLTGTGYGTYWVVVDSTTINPDAGYNGGFNLGDVWGEQTWGSAGAVTFDGSYNYLGASGALYGGMQFEVSDDASSLTSAEHVTRAIVGGANVTGVDSAFSFNVVTRTGDGDDDLGANRSMQGSLRQFIQNSNAIVGTQSSQFAISTTDSNYNLTGNGEYTIQVGAGGYDTMTDTIILDATTQNGYSGDPLIELDGTNAIGSTAGLVLRTDNSTIRGFIIHSFPDDGIEIDGQTGFGDNNTVQNNWVGIDATGMAAGNLDDGLIIAFGATGNQIGGTGANDGNVFSGNLGVGVAIRDAGSDNNVVEGNYIGVGPDGVTAIANQEQGVYIFAGPSGNRIGGSAAGAGNVISGNNLSGVALWDATTTLNIVIGNYIGTDYTGTVAVGNTEDGIHIGGGASNNVIGGVAPGEGNVISGNLEDGIEFLSAGTSGNSVLGNYIGTNAAGTAALGNGRHGIVIYDGVNNTTIGGSIAGAGNVISANGTNGIVIDGNGGATTINNTILGNYIGTNATGTLALGNGNSGIRLFQNADNNTIGGAAPGEGNVISGNINAGIQIEFSDNVDILGNLIGTAADGISAMGNGGDGVWVFNSDFVTIGSPGAGNVIADSGDSGVEIGDSVLASIQSNFIGTDQSGSLDLGNAGSGVVLWGVTLSTSIGGTNPGEGNIIAHSGNNGIYLDETVGGGNAILGNSIHSNAQLGIELVESGPVWGVTENDPLDADFGPNDLQNFPLLISANTDEGSNVYIAGSIQAAAGTTYRIEFFANSTQDGSGHGEGETFLGYIDVVTDGTGRASFSATFSANVAAGSFITTTATSPGMSTSEFSADVVTLDMGTLVVDTSIDAVDGDTSSIAALLANRGADNRISLREAIQATNLTPNAGVPDQIHFNLQLDDPNRFYYQNDGVPGQLSTVVGTTLDDADVLDFDPDYPVGAGHSWFRIQPTTGYTISDAVIIDGYTQSGATPNTLGIGTDAILKIEINGDLSGNADAFTVNASSTELRGLTINGDFNIAIAVNASNVVVSGNYIGTDVTGMNAGTNLNTGLYISSGASSNVIGGAAAADRNVISGTTSNAIWLLNGTTQNNSIRGNYIGTDATGTAAIVNPSNAIVLTDGTHDNTIQDNLISGNNVGILLDGTIAAPDSNTIIGNLIGTDVTGTLALANALGIWLQNGVTNTTIGGTNASQRNVISGNLTDGIRIHGAGSSGNSVLGNLIGTDISGTVGLGNGESGIEIGDFASANTIGGTVASERNIVADNSVSGVDLTSGAFGNFVQGNYVGVDSSGATALGHGFAGIRLLGGANNNTIGGTAAGAGNVISGNSDGIYISDAATTGNIVQGNLIGTDFTGTVDVGNLDDGIEILNGASNNLIGGSAAGARNIISGNNGDGVAISGAGTAGNFVYGNYIGTNAAGTAAIANGSGGVRVSDFATGNYIGGSGAGEGNLISGNSWGVQIFADAFGNFVQGNLIGTDWTGTAALGNLNQGIAIQTGANNNTIGGTVANSGNVIAHNGSTGVQIAADAGSGNSILGNSIYDNTGLGIEVMPWGVDANIVTLSTAVTDGGGNITIDGTITGATPGTTYRVEFFANVTGDPSGSGEGEIYLGFADIVVDGSGNATFSVPLLAVVPAGYEISATATGPGENTTEFAANVVATQANTAPVLTPAAPSVPTINEDDTGNGGIQISTLLGGSVTDPDTGAVEGIAITSLSSGNGTWQYSTDGGFTWLDVGAVSDASALLLRASDYIRFVPDGENADAASFDFRAWDQTSGVFGTKVDTAPNGGITAFSTVNDTASITVTAVNDAPALIPATPGLPPISEDEVNNGGILISTLLGGSVTDVDTGALGGIAVTGLSSSNGTWQYSTDGGFTWLDVGAVSDASALLLRASDYIRFVPDGENADAASFDFRAWDQTSGTFGTKVDTAPSGGITAFSTVNDSASITVTAVNDAPALTPATPGLPPISEDEVNNGGILISTLLGGSVTDVDTGALGGIAVTGLSSSNGTWQYSTDGGFTWLDVGAVSDASALLLRASDYIRFVPDGENADAASFDFRAWDQTSGTFGTKVDTAPNGGITAFSTVNDSASITVTAVNDAPALTPATPGLPPISEDEVNNGGILISTLLGGSVTDVDTGALGGIAVTGLSSSNGTWQYSTDGGFTWLDVGAVSDASALLLRASDYIRFVPDGENADAASFDFRAWDHTGGLFGSKVDTSPNGGTTAFSTATDTADISVAAVNDAPVLTPAMPSLPTIGEDATNNSGIAISTLLGGSATDVDFGSQIGIAITGLSSGNGTWQYSLDGITWVDMPAVSDNAALVLGPSDRVRFVPDGIDADSASFTFRAWDWTGGPAGSLLDTTLNGGTTPFSTSIDTASIAVTSNNDAPTTTGVANVAVDEDSLPVLIDLFSIFSDLEDLPGELVYSVAGNTNPSLFSGATIDAVLGTLTLALTPDANGQTTITLRAVDTDGDLVETTFLFNVNAINDAPFTTGSGVLSTIEDGPAASFDLYSLFGDIDDLNTSLTFSIVANNNSVLTTASIDAATGTLNMSFAADTNGTSTLTLRVTDASGAFVDTNFLVTVDPVDDAVFNEVPTLQSVLSGQFLLFSSASGNGISVSDIDSSNITVSLSVPGGLLTLGSTSGLVFTEGDGTGDQQIIFTGSVSDVNAALDGLSFQPLEGFDGVVALQVATWSPDLPPAERAAVSSETISVLILEAVAPEQTDLPEPADNTLEITAENDSDAAADSKTEDAEPGSDTVKSDPPIQLPPVSAAEFAVPFEAVRVAVPPAPDSGTVSPREYVSTLSRLLVQLGTDAKLPAFVVSDAIWDALDTMKEEMAGLDGVDAENQQLLVTMATGLTLTLSAGFVTWMMRAGALLTSLLSTTPMWQRFDPLPVLAGRQNDDEQESQEKDAEAVKVIFGGDR